MRSTLIVCLFVAIVFTVAAPTASLALEPSYGVNLNETVETPTSWIATTAEFHWCGLFGFFSSTCGQKAIVFEGVDIVMVPDLVGYRHLREIKLIARSTSGVRREFCVSKEDLKHGIYMVTVTGLRPAEWIFTWEIKSKDKTRTYGVLFIRFSHNGNRVTGASIHVTVQIAPSNLFQLSPQIAFGYTRGLIEAWATMDPAYAAKLAAQPQPQPQPVQPAYNPPSAEPIPNGYNNHEEERSEGGGLVTLVVDFGKKRIVKWEKVPFDEDVSKDDILEFRRNGQVLAAGEVTKVESSENGIVVRIRIIDGDIFKPPFTIFLMDPDPEGGR